VVRVGQPYAADLRAELRRAVLRRALLRRAVLRRAVLLRAVLRADFFDALFRADVPRRALLFDADRFEADERFMPALRLPERFFIADDFLAPDFFAADFFVAAITMPPELELSIRSVPRWTAGWDGRA